ncbi:MAG: NADPH-quinone oxidoreductase [Gemmatimonadetes bacterium]|nr:NADPH-quinone oxidoreductase [Gemmatimonadota bacterium]|tara:strand:+ start:2041 stop:2577 length:537 start_codon:yes stop_codon:yes gene_type:complete
MSRYFANIYQSLSSIWVGMNITLKHLFTPAITLQYPEERWEMPERARNQLFNDIDDCIGCDQCARACPVDCIYIETEKTDDDLGLTSKGTKKRLKVLRFDIDMSLCCYCGLCTYPCPTECLVMTPNYESSVYDRTDLLYKYAKPWEYDQKSEPAPESDDVPDAEDTPDEEAKEAASAD